MNDEGGSYVDYIDDATWQRVVGALLDSDGVEIISRQSPEIFVGIAAGTHLYRVAGTAGDGDRRPVDWSMVVKVRRHRLGLLRSRAHRRGVECSGRRYPGLYGEPARALGGS
jgi:hypothetical protein